MKKKLSIVLVHGFWGGAAHWSKVIVELASKGYELIHAVENPLTSLADDAERTRKMVAQHTIFILIPDSNLLTPLISPPSYPQTFPRNHRAELGQ